MQRCEGEVYGWVDNGSKVKVKGEEEEMVLDRVRINDV